MPPRRKAVARDAVNRCQELGNQARNEKQKSLLLTEVARLRGNVEAAQLCQDSAKLVKKSEDLLARSKKIREDRRAS